MCPICKESRNPEDTIQCPYCKANVGKEVSICPNCKKVIGDKMLGIIGFTALIVIGGLVIIWNIQVARKYGSDPPRTSSYSSSQLPTNVTPESYSVKYQVSGTANSASLTYSNAQGGTEQMEVSIPWEKALTVEKGNFLYLSAQNKGEYGSITVKILINNKAWKESTSSGAFVIANCNGSAGE